VIGSIDPAKGEGRTLVEAAVPRRIDSRHKKAS
jgi:hypothetical protein